MIGIKALLNSLGYTKTTELTAADFPALFGAVEKAVKTTREAFRVRNVQQAAVASSIQSTAASFDAFLVALDEETSARVERKGPKILIAAKEKLAAARTELTNNMISLRLGCDLRDSLPMEEAIAALEETVRGD